MKSFFSQTRNSNHHFNPPHDSFSRSSVNIPDKRSIRVTKNIKDDIAALYQNGIGLQSILRNDGSHVIDRTRIEEDDGCIPCRSDTKSTQSESRSLKTYMSSATSNGVNSRQSNTDIMTPASINDEDMIQKYYFELRNSLKSCLSTKQPSVYFKDIAGNTYAKKVIQEAFVLSNLPSDGLKGKHKSCNKILLYGPPGVGKTMMARAVAKEVHATILWVSLADITSKFMSESEKLLRMLFELARERSPSVIIIDEMDSLGRIRNANESDTERRIKIEFLKQMDEISNGNDNVYVLATTNMPWELDIAALRRFEGRIFLPMPDMDARFEILKLSVGDHPHELTDEDFKCLATLMNGYTGSDISNVVKDALMKPAKMLHETSYFKKVTTKLDNQTEELFYMPCCKEEVGSILMDFIDISRDKLIFRKVNLSDFKESVKNCSPTVSSSALSLYNKFLSKYGNVEQKEDLTTEEKDYEHFYL